MNQTYSPKVVYLLGLIFGLLVGGMGLAYVEIKTAWILLAFWNGIITFLFVLYEAQTGSNAFNSIATSLVIFSGLVGHDRVFVKHGSTFGMQELSQFLGVYSFVLAALIFLFNKRLLKMEKEHLEKSQKDRDTSGVEFLKS